MRPTLGDALHYLDNSVGAARALRRGWAAQDRQQRRREPTPHRRRRTQELALRRQPRGRPLGGDPVLACPELPARRRGSLPLLPRRAPPPAHPSPAAHRPADTSRLGRHLRSKRRGLAPPCRQARVKQNPPRRCLGFGGRLPHLILDGSQIVAPIYRSGPDSLSQI